jgi:hypothetical protein
VWCGKCYSSSNTFHKFHIQESESFSDGTSDNVEDSERLQVAWGEKHRPAQQYTHGRNGDHLITPFECDLCIFRKLRRHSPDITLLVDQRLLDCIRRVNLDAFWSRASSTVKGNHDRVKVSLQISKNMGLDGPYYHDGPMPDYDYCGYELAIQMVDASRRPGRHSSAYTQFDTVRKYRSAFTSFYRTTPQGNRLVMGLVNNKGQLQRFVQDPTVTVWFQRFITGCERRMGNVWKPNMAFQTPLLLKVIDAASQHLEESVSPSESDRWLVFVTYCVVTYTLSLRGTEGFYLDLGGLHKYKDKGSSKHILIPLLGKIKGEHSERCHLMPCTLVTSSGIGVAYWVNRLREHKAKLGFTDGPAISDLRGRVLSCASIDDSLHEILEELWESHHELFPNTVTKREDIRSSYQAFRSFRRASATRAIENKVSSNDIDVVNRWHAWDAAAGKKPSLSMRQHYTQYSLLLDPFLRYTNAM